jgi:hypothetical protein
MGAPGRIAALELMKDRSGKRGGKAA